MVCDSAVLNWQSHGFSGPGLRLIREGLKSKGTREKGVYACHALLLPLEICRQALNAHTSSSRSLKLASFDLFLFFFYFAQRHAFAPACCTFLSFLEAVKKNEMKKNSTAALMNDMTMQGCSYN